MSNRKILAFLTSILLALSPAAHAQDSVNEQIAQAAAAGNAAPGGATQQQPSGASANTPANASPDTPEDGSEASDVVKVNLRIMKVIFSNNLNISYGSRSKKRTQAKKETITLWYKTGLGDTAAWKSVDINDGEATQRISYEGPNKLVFYARRPPAAPDQPPVFTEVCDTFIPDGVEDMYLLMFKSGDSITFYSMNVSPNSLPRGKTVLVNMTNYPLLVSLGAGKPFLLARGKNVVCAARKMDENDAELIIAWRIGKRWERCARTTVPMSSEDTRTVLLAYKPDKNAKHLNINVLNY